MVATAAAPANHPPRHNLAYHCSTEARGAGIDICGAQVGHGHHIWRWARGSALRYIICDESFPRRVGISQLEKNLAQGMGMWNGIGVVFERVERFGPAHFLVAYKHLENDHRRILASAFFPEPGPPNSRTFFLCLQPCSAKRFYISATRRFCARDKYEPKAEPQFHRLQLRMSM